MPCVLSFQITGDTVYNLMKIGELETDKEDRPVDPPQIVSVEVIQLYVFYNVIWLHLLEDSNLIFYLIVST